MRIKKYKDQSESLSLQKKLLNYRLQAKGRNLKDRPNSNRNLYQGTLTALVPFVAIGGANAQCQGGAGTFVLNTRSYFRIDVDGDGTDDFEFYKLTTFTLEGLGSNSFIRAGNYVQRLDSGSTVTAGQVFFGGAAAFCDAYYNTVYRGSFLPGHPTDDNFVGIRQGPKVGFLRLTVTKCTTGSGGAVIQINDMAYEQDGDGSVIMGDCGTLLPVEFSFFEAKIENNQIQLEWETLSELNNDGFEVQRSTDSRIFHKIAWIAGQGTTHIRNSYQFIDAQAKANTNYYYRLKQIDHGGEESYTPIRTAFLEDQGQVGVSNLFPNPVGKAYGASWLELNVPQNSEAILHLYDARGQLIQTIEKGLIKGQNRFPIKLDNLANGSYFLKIGIGNKVFYRKLILKE